MSLHQNYINGAWVAADDVARNINPSNTNEVVGEYARASAGQALEAIHAAKAAAPGWMQSGIQQRFDVASVRLCARARFSSSSPARCCA
jgi:aldehyde dehydrogenase (NAD+)